MSYFDELFGPVRAYLVGVAQVVRAKWNFSSDFSVSDDAVNGWLDISVSGAGGGGMSRVLYVDKAGHDASAVRGSIKKKYLTITAALAAAQSGDRIEIGAGTYVEALTLPNLAKLAIVGAGRDVTIIQPVTEVPAVYIPATNDNFVSVSIERLTVSAVVGMAAIRVVGTDTAELVSIKDCRLNSTTYPISVSLCYQVEVIDCYLGPADTGGDCLFEQIDELKWHNVDCAVTIGGACTVGLSVVGNPVETWPSNATFGTAEFFGCKVGAVALSGIVQAEFRGCKTGNVTCSFESGTLDGTTRNGKLTSDSVHGAVAITLANAPSPAAVSAVLRGQVVSVAISKTEGGANRGFVDAKGCIVVGAVDAENLCDIDIRGGRYGSLVVAGNGAIERSIHRGTVDLNALVPPSVTITPPFMTNTYQVVIVPGTLGVTANAPIGDRSALEFSAESSADSAGSEYIIFHD